MLLSYLFTWNGMPNVQGYTGTNALLSTQPAAAIED